MKDLRMKTVKDTHIAVIPEDFTETDVIDWQNSHKVCNKTEAEDYNNNKIREWRKRK